MVSRILGIKQILNKNNVNNEKIINLYKSVLTKYKIGDYQQLFYNENLNNMRLFDLSNIFDNHNSLTKLEDINYIKSLDLSHNLDIYTTQIRIHMNIIPPNTNEFYKLPRYISLLEGSLDISTNDNKIKLLEGGICVDKNHNINNPHNDVCVIVSLTELLNKNANRNIPLL